MLTSSKDVFWNDHHWLCQPHKENKEDKTQTTEVGCFSPKQFYLRKLTKFPKQSLQRNPLVPHICSPVPTPVR